MIQWIWTLLQKLWNWGVHDGLARGVSGNEGTQQKTDRTSDQRSGQPSIQLVTGSNARDWKKMKGIKDPEPPNCQSSLEEFLRSTKDQGI